MFSLSNLYKFISETRDKGLYKIMRPYFDNTPEYVFRELFYAHNGFFKNEFQGLLDTEAEDDEIEDTFMEWTDIKWKKKVISVNINDFTRSSQESMKSRGMGTVHMDHVPDDEKRTELQKELAAKYKGGKNEPVILIKTGGGYELLEGWHRTMSILSLGMKEDTDYNKWDKVKLNAWIGVGDYNDEIAKNFGTF
tara:strand:+ start:2554 stop:3135 length:582 start_codon:yes stop_codon:yes gene_type:complete